MFDFIFKWLGKIKDWLSLAVNVIDWIEDNYPGLAAIIEPLVGAMQVKIDKDEITKDEARELVVAKAKEATTASPRFVPESVIRMAVEAFVYRMKHVMSMRKYNRPTYYDAPSTREHAHKILSGRR